MGSCRDHKILSERRSGCFRLVRCSCGTFTLLTGGAAIRLEARHLADLGTLLGGVRAENRGPEIGKALTEGPFPGILAELRPLQGADLSPRGWN